MSLLPIPSPESSEVSEASEAREAPPGRVTEHRARIVAIMSQATDVIDLLVESMPESGGGEALERGVRKALSAAGCAVIGVAVEKGDTDAKRLERDGDRYHRVPRQRKRIVTTFGVLKYERYCYRHRDLTLIAPADDRFGIVCGSWSPLAAKLASLSMTKLPAAECSRYLGHLGGMQPSATALNNLVKRLGANLEASGEQVLDGVREQEEVPENARALVVSVDGVMVGMRKQKASAEEGVTPRPAGFREAASGTVSLLDAEGKRLRTHYHARMPEAGKVTLKAALLKEVEHYRKSPLRLAFIADGAPDNWRWCEEAFPEAVQIYDFWHSTQHLKSALNQIFGEGSPEGQKQFERLRRILKNDVNGVDRVLRYLRDYRRSRRAKDEISRVIEFFKTQRKRMRYATFRQQGLPIGSGTVEAANKVLVTQRLKCSGMRWSENGTAQSILSLRALSHSSRFDAAWDQIMKIMKPPPFTLHQRRRPAEVHKLAPVAD